MGLMNEIKWPIKSNVIVFGAIKHITLSPINHLGGWFNWGMRFVSCFERFLLLRLLLLLLLLVHLIIESHHNVLLYVDKSGHLNRVRGYISSGCNNKSPFTAYLHTFFVFGCFLDAIKSESLSSGIWTGSLTAALPRHHHRCCPIFLVTAKLN